MMQQVKITEVGPRDGLQNEARQLDVPSKLELISRLVNCGLRHIEAGALVSPRWVPQMADSLAVLQALDQQGAVHYSALVPNEQGLEAALNSGVQEIAVFGAASETFSQKNIHSSIEDSLQRFALLSQRALDAGLAVRAYVSCVVACPYEGAIAPAQVAQVAKRLYEMGCYEVSLGDTIGVGSPRSVLAMLAAVSQQVPMAQLAGHFHDTYGMAIANIYACLQAGMRSFDASIAGLGGCPYAKGASGNVATEDVVYLLQQEGYHTGVDRTALLEVARFIRQRLSETATVTNVATE